MIDIELTAAACKRARELVSQAGCKGLRLAVRPAGCSGLENLMDLADGPVAGDLVQSYDGFELYVDAASYATALTGLRLDFQQDLLSSGFVYNNPNQKGACGCGKSFSV
ncbi:MAG: iron-sulfur cluster assembly accessory protein [Mariprofundus sp.]